LRDKVGDEQGEEGERSREGSDGEEGWGVGGEWEEGDCNVGRQEDGGVEKGGRGPSSWFLEK